MSYYHHMSANMSISFFTSRFEEICANYCDQPIGGNINIIPLIREYLSELRKELLDNNQLSIDSLADLLLNKDGGVIRRNDISTLRVLIEDVICINDKERETDSSDELNGFKERPNLINDIPIILNRLQSIQ